MASKQTQQMFNRDVWMAGLLSACFFFSFANPSLCLDQDQGSKIAKIENLARDYWFASPMRGPQYYREAYFGVYYQIEALIRKLIPLPAITIGNYSSAFLGAVFVITLCIFFKRLTGVGPWWILFLVLNTPALAINFLYANEAAFSITFVAIAATVIASSRGLVSDITGGGVFGLSLFCRPDVIFLVPFLLVLACTAAEEPVVLDVKMRRIIVIGGTSFLTSLSYWLIFIRSFPAQTTFPWIIDYKLIASYLFFGFGPVVVFMAIVGGIKRFIRLGFVQLLLPMSTLIPFAFYYRDLGSTKYILGFAFGTLLCACWTIASFPRLALASLPCAALLWFVSFTPFGIFGYGRGGHWVIPVGHGPISFGSYASFYTAIRKGFFQNRYSALKQAWEEVLPTILSSSEQIRIVGASDVHMLVFLCEEKGLPVCFGHLVEMDYTGQKLGFPGKQVMLFNSYTRLSYLTANGAEAQVREWLYQGLVKPLSTSDADSGMPLAVEIGPSVTDGSRELGKRIIFAGQKAYESGLAPLSSFESDYNAFCWMPSSAHLTNRLYSDSRFTATTDCAKASLTWGNWWPAIYYSRYADRAKDALAPK